MVHFEIYLHGFIFHILQNVERSTEMQNPFCQEAGKRSLRNKLVWDLSGTIFQTRDSTFQI